MQSALSSPVFFIFHPHRFSFYSRNVSIVLRFLWKGKIICNDILSKSKCLPGTVKFCCRWDEKCVVPDNLRLSWQWKIRQLSRIVHIVAKINRSQHYESDLVDGISKCWQNSAYLVSHISAHLLKSVQKHKLVQPAKLCVYLQLCKRLFTQCIIYSEAWLTLQMLSSANPTHLIIKK